MRVRVRVTVSVRVRVGVRARWPFLSSAGKSASLLSVVSTCSRVVSRIVIGKHKLLIKISSEALARRDEPAEVLVLVRTIRNMMRKDPANKNFVAKK